MGISYEEVVTEKLVVKTGSHEGEGESVIESGRMDSGKMISVGVDRNGKRNRVRLTRD